MTFVRLYKKVVLKLVGRIGRRWPVEPKSCSLGSLDNLLKGGSPLNGSSVNSLIMWNLGGGLFNSELLCVEDSNQCDRIIFPFLQRTHGLAVA